MDMDAKIVFEQMLVLLLMIFVGMAVCKLRIINKDASRQISSLMVKLFNPALLISSAIEDGGNVKSEALIAVGVFTVLMYVFLIIIGKLISNVLVKYKEDRIMYQLMTVFSNVAFIGIPVVKSLYGHVGVIYTAVFNLGYSCCFYTYGLWLVNQAAENNKQKVSLRSLWNPGVIACAITLFLTLVKIPIPFFISGAVEYLGSASVPLALLLVGVSLAQNDWKTIFLDWKIYVFSVIKLVAIPLLMMLALATLKLDPVVYGVTILMTAMPVGNMAVIGPESVGMDSSICARGVMVTTILTLVTVPVITMFL